MNDDLARQILGEIRALKSALRGRRQPSPAGEDPAVVEFLARIGCVARNVHNHDRRFHGGLAAIRLWAAGRLLRTGELKLPRPTDVFQEGSKRCAAYRAWLARSQQAREHLVAAEAVR